MNTHTAQQHQHPETARTIRFLRLPDVSKRYGPCRSSIYRDVSAGTFPAPIKIGKRAIAWLESDLDAWAASRIAASRGEGAPPTAAAAAP